MDAKTREAQLNALQDHMFAAHGRGMLEFMRHETPLPKCEQCDELMEALRAA